MTENIDAGGLELEISSSLATEVAPHSAPAIPAPCCAYRGSLLPPLRTVTTQAVSVCILVSVMLMVILASNSRWGLAECRHRDMTDDEMMKTAYLWGLFGLRVFEDHKTRHYSWRSIEKGALCGTAKGNETKTVFSSSPSAVLPVCSTDLIIPALHWVIVWIVCAWIVGMSYLFVSTFRRNASTDRKPLVAAALATAGLFCSSALLVAVSMYFATFKHHLQKIDFCDAFCGVYSSSSSSDAGVGDDDAAGTGVGTVFDVQIIRALFVSVMPGQAGNGVSESNHRTEFTRQGGNRRTSDGMNEEGQQKQMDPDVCVIYHVRAHDALGSGSSGVVSLRLAYWACTLAILGYSLRLVMTWLHKRDNDKRFARVAHYGAARGEMAAATDHPRHTNEHLSHTQQL